MAAETTLERRVKVLIDLRRYNVLKKEEQKEGVHFIVETPGKSKQILWTIPASGTIGVRYINQLKKTIESTGLEGGVIISDGPYTPAAKSIAQRKRIELIPLESPAFNIFKHVLIPIHQILTPEEREELAQKYTVKPYQLPKIKASDPVAKASGPGPGDVLGAVRDSATAGKYISYRYVIEG